MRNLKKFCITTIASLGILSTSVFAVTGIVNAPSGLVLRKESSKSGEPLATVPDKTEVNITEENDEWYKVKYNEQEGYLFKEYVNTDTTEEETEQEPETSDATVETPDANNQNIQAKGKIKVYMIPVITSTVINEIEENAEIKVEKEITNWSYVTSGNIQGWVRTYGIKNEVQVPVEAPTEIPVEEEPTETTRPSETEKPEVQEPEQEKTTVTTKPADNSSSTEKPATTSKGFIAVDSATVRTKATTDSEVVTYLIKGTSFKILAETEEWYKITYTTPEEVVYEGYIFKELVTTDNN